MVRFTAKKAHSMPVPSGSPGDNGVSRKPYSDYTDDDGANRNKTEAPSTASKLKKALAGAVSTARGTNRHEYDAAPHSRYDPTTMSRIGIDIHSDNELDIDEMIDPHYYGGDRHAGEQGLSDPLGDDLDGLFQAQMRRRPRYRPSAACRRCLCMTLLFCGVMALVVGITHLLVGRNAASTMSSWLHHKTPHGTTLPSAPSNLSQMCSTAAIAQPGGYTKCEAACVEAECCFLPEGHWFSCKADFASECAGYEADCMVLDGYDGSGGGGGGGGGNAISVEVPAPPANLDEMCGSASLATVEGFEQCSEGCELARCCSQPIEVS